MTQVPGRDDQWMVTIEQVSFAAIDVQTYEPDSQPFVDSVSRTAARARAERCQHNTGIGVDVVENGLDQCQINRS